MSLVNVNEDINIINVDESWLRQIRVNNNTLDNGAMLVMDGLKQFIDEQMAAFKGREVPYEELFLMLRQIIENACENDTIRNALMTGVIAIKKKFNSVAKTKKKKQVRIKRDVAEVKEYAKTHTLKEVTKRFSFSTENTCRQYLFHYHIEFVKKRRGRTRLSAYDKLEELSKKMTLIQLAFFFGRTPSTIHHALKIRGLKQKGCRK